MSGPFHEGPMLGFDLETTGTDPFTARIVTATLIQRVPGYNDEHLDWLVNPGVEIPAEATAVHGVSTYKADTEGQSPETALEEMCLAITDWLEQGYPLVVFNAAYDLTLLNAEFARHGLEPIGDYRPVLDPFVIDKQADKYRKGKRTLSACCEQYGVSLDLAHTSSADATAAIDVTVCLAEKYPELQEPAEKIHGWTVTWRAQQCESLQKYFRRDNPDAIVNGQWPVQIQEQS